MFIASSTADLSRDSGPCRSTTRRAIQIQIRNQTKSCFIDGSQPIRLPSQRQAFCRNNAIRYRVTVFPFMLG